MPSINSARYTQRIIQRIIQTVKSREADTFSRPDKFDHDTGLPVDLPSPMSMPWGDGHGHHPYSTVIMYGHLKSRSRCLTVHQLVRVRVNYCKDRHSFRIRAHLKVPEVKLNFSFVAKNYLYFFLKGVTIRSALLFISSG